MPRKAGRLTPAAFGKLAKAADRVERTPLSHGLHPKQQKGESPIAFPVLLLDSIGAPITPEDAGGHVADLTETSKFVRLITYNNLDAYQLLVEEDCILTVDGFVLTETVTSETTRDELQTLLDEAGETTLYTYHCDVVAENVFIRREGVLTEDIVFSVTSTTPASNTTAANEVWLVDWWPSTVEEDGRVAWKVTKAIPGGSVVLGVNGQQRGTLFFPPFAESGGGTTETTSCCDCTVITNSDMGFNGVATTSRWDIELNRDATYIFDNGFLVVKEGTYRVIWNETKEGWYKNLDSASLLGATVFIYLTDGTDVSTESDRVDLDVVVAIEEMHFLFVPDNGLDRVQLSLKAKLTVEDNREEE